MANIDLDIAKQESKEKKLGLVIVKSGKVVFTNSEYGIIGFIKAIDSRGDALDGASVVDAVVGKAAAMLCRYAKVKAVQAKVMSRRGVDALSAAGIDFEYEELVPSILNRSKTAVCPFEKLTADCDDVKECYDRIKNFLSGNLSDLKSTC